MGDLRICLVFQVEANNPRFVGYARAYVVIKAAGLHPNAAFLQLPYGPPDGSDIHLENVSNVFLCEYAALLKHFICHPADLHFAQAVRAMFTKDFLISGTGVNC
jgi:hypothetical protein